MNRFQGPTIPPPFAGHKPLETWRCPDCESLELTPFQLMLNHGWNPAPGANDERPCKWALDEEKLELCLRQLRAIGGRKGVDNGLLPPKFPGLWQARGPRCELVQVWVPA